MPFDQHFRRSAARFSALRSHSAELAGSRRGGMASARVPASAETVGEIGSYLRRYVRSPRAANRADTTVYKYRLAVEQLIDFLTDAGMPTRADAVRGEHIEVYIEAFLQNHKPRPRTLATNRFKCSSASPCTRVRVARDGGG